MTDPQPETEPETLEEPEAGVEPERGARARPRGRGAPRRRARPDPQVRRPGAAHAARPVERFDDALRDEVERMGELMNDALGVGLAATQVGVLHRLLVYRVQQQARRWPR